jgi:hypothetical protein
MADRIRLACFLLALVAVFPGVRTFAAAPPQGPTLPAALAKASMSPVYLGNDLARVPEVIFETPPAKELSTREWEKRIETILKRAAQFDSREGDGFVKVLIRERRDLGGLPFLLGGDCRRGKDLAAAFELTTLRVRGAGKSSQGITDALRTVTNELRQWNGHVDEAEVAAVAQIMGGMHDWLRLKVTSHLARLPHTQATIELARLAVFDPDRQVRTVALKSLSKRSRDDYTHVLIKALRYPWPAVAQNAAEGLVSLQRKDLLPELVDMLDEPDPRLPRTEKVGGKAVSLTRELVRINHHKSCLLCHASGSTEKARRSPDSFFLAPVPVPTEPLDSGSGGYLQQREEKPSHLLVRVEVTYLRQDFSALQRVAVEESAQWPVLQRFDYLVRKRVLSGKEAADLKARLCTGLSPYHRIAAKALRDLTGHDLPAKADVWRKRLRLRAKLDG